MYSILREATDRLRKMRSHASLVAPSTSNSDFLLLLLVNVNLVTLEALSILLNC